MSTIYFVILKKCIFSLKQIVISPSEHVNEYSNDEFQNMYRFPIIFLWYRTKNILNIVSSLLNFWKFGNWKFSKYLNTKAT